MEKMSDIRNKINMLEEEISEVKRVLIKMQSPSHKKQEIVE